MLPTITQLQHPEYIIGTMQWLQWRLCYTGGHDFKVAYLKKYSQREDNADFMLRKEMAYSPAFAKACINEVKNSIYEKLDSVMRLDGSQAYQDACTGLNGGVDYLSNSMKSFMGVKILPELMVMSKVGIYVDSPPRAGQSLMSNLGLRPYLYMYRIEDIMNWVYDVRMQFQSLLLREYVYEYDEETGFPTEMVTRFRHLWVENGRVWLQFHAVMGQPLGEPIQLNLKKIPFYCLQLSQSLMADISDYQIALLQLASSDLLYAMRSNFPFYVEQFEPFSDAMYMKTDLSPGAVGTEGTTDQANPNEITIGSSQGRRYPKGMDAPSFISPSSEPLKASMEKQAQMKEEMRLLLNLTIQNLRPTRTSAEAKREEAKPAENGLAYIGMELEMAERQIAEIWADYEKTEPATVYYPTNYSSKSDADNRAEAKANNELMPSLPSPTYQREVGKLIASSILGNKVTAETMKKIYKEIDTAPNMVCDPAMVTADVESGLVDKDTASRARCWPKGSADKAADEFVERAKQIALAQAEAAPAGAQGARGVPETSISGAKEPPSDKQGKSKRGEGK